MVTIHPSVCLSEVLSVISQEGKGFVGFMQK